MKSSYFKLEKKITVPLLFFLFLLVIPTVSATPPFQSTTVSSGSLQILISDFDIIQANKPYEIDFHLFNSTNILTNNTAQCSLHLNTFANGITGNHVLTYSKLAGAVGTRDFIGTIPANNLSTTGDYCMSITCNTSIQSGGAVHCFEVTARGLDISQSYIWIILALSIIVIVIGLSFNDYTITTLGSFALVLAGLYMLFYGIAEAKNATTNGLAIIVLAVGGYIMAKTGLNFVRDNYD